MGEFLSDLLFEFEEDLINECTEACYQEQGIGEVCSLAEKWEDIEWKELMGLS